MKEYKERNNLYEIDALIHDRIFRLPTQDKENIPKYSSDLALAMFVAEKVRLFDTIMLAKDGESWLTLQSPTEITDEDQYQKLFSSGLDLRVVAFSSGFTVAEAVARACLVLKAKENEQSSRSNQQDSR